MYGAAFSKDAGRIIYVKGHVQRNSITTGELLPCTRGTVILENNRIKTGPLSRVQVLLYNGLIIIMEPDSSLMIFTVKNSDEEPPAKIKLEYGKAVFSSRPRYRGISTVLTTPTSQLEIEEADFAIVTCSSSAVIFVAKGNIASASYPGKSASLSIEKNKIIVIENTGILLQPALAKPENIQTWLDKYSLNSSKTRILKNNAPGKIFDSILRGRN